MPHLITTTGPLRLLRQLTPLTLISPFPMFWPSLSPTVGLSSRPPTTSTAVRASMTRVSNTLGSTRRLSNADVMFYHLLTNTSEYSAHHHVITSVMQPHHQVLPRNHSIFRHYHYRAFPSFQVRRATSAHELVGQLAAYTDMNQPGLQEDHQCARHNHRSGQNSHQKATVGPNQIARSGEWGNTSARG